MTILIASAGFAGTTAARVFAEAGYNVLLIDSRNHIAGNDYDYHDYNGILMQRYGPHIFHTNRQKIFDFLSRLTQWSHVSSAGQ